MGDGDGGLPEPRSSLGDRLVLAVRNLWARVKVLETEAAQTRKIVDHQGGAIEAVRAEMRSEMREIRSQLHGLKVSRGRALAKNTRLQQQIAEAEGLLSETEKRLH